MIPIMLDAKTIVDPFQAISICWLEELFLEEVPSRHL